jgi:hypothetical protein
MLFILCIHLYNVDPKHITASLYQILSRKCLIYDFKSSYSLLFTETCMYFPNLDVSIYLSIYPALIVRVFICLLKHIIHVYSILQ